MNTLLSVCHILLCIVHAASHQLRPPCVVPLSQSELQDAQRLMLEGIWQADKYAQEAAQLHSQISSMEMSQRPGGGAARTVSEIDAELEDSELQRSRAELSKEDYR